MSTVIEKVKAQEHLRETASETAYQELVRDSHAGVEVDPRKALEILEAAGRDSADLEEDCKLLDARAECQKLAAEIPALQAAMDKNRATLEQAKAALAAAEREARGIAEQIEADNARITRRLNECQRAVNRLRTAPELRDEANWSARQQLIRQRGELSQALQKAEAMAAPGQIAADRGVEERHLHHQLQHHQARGRVGRTAAEFQAELDAIQANLDALPGKYAARIEHRDQLRARVAKLEAQEKALEAQAISG